jgi:transcriptional antiterminator RfaH
MPRPSVLGMYFQTNNFGDFEMSILLEPSDDPHSLSWHLIYTKPRGEARAMENLVRQGFEVFLPIITMQKVRRGNLTSVTEPMFSRYLFIRATSIMPDLSLVRSTLGVIQLVRFGTVPARVPNDWVEAMRLQPAIHEKLFNAGDKLLIGNGMLKGLDAIYVQPDGETRAMVLINLLNKPHMVSYETTNLLPQPAY